jgi:hypothetical protein
MLKIETNVKVYGPNHAKERDNQFVKDLEELAEVAKTTPDASFITLTEGNETKYKYAAKKLAEKGLYFVFRTDLEKTDHTRIWSTTQAPKPKKTREKKAEVTGDSIPSAVAE